MVDITKSYNPLEDLQEKNKELEKQYKELKKSNEDNKRLSKPYRMPSSKAKDFRGKPKAREPIKWP